YTKQLTHITSILKQPTHLTFTLFPYTTLFRSDFSKVAADPIKRAKYVENVMQFLKYTDMDFIDVDWEYPNSVRQPDLVDNKNDRSEEHTSELQSRFDIVCRLLLEKKKYNNFYI